MGNVVRPPILTPAGVLRKGLTGASATGAERVRGWGSGFFLIVSGVLAACGMASVVLRTGVSFLVDDRKEKKFRQKSAAAYFVATHWVAICYAG